MSPLPPTILVAEDDAIVRLDAVMNLEDAGYRVIEAEDADEALRRLGEDHIDLVFTDINMPGPLNGLDMARQAHQRWPSLRFVVTSGEYKVQPGELPDAGRFLPKPYSKGALIGAIEAGLV